MTSPWKLQMFLMVQYLFLSTGPRGTGSFGAFDFFFFPSRRKPEPENAWNKTQVIIYFSPVKVPVTPNTIIHL